VPSKFSSSRTCLAILTAALVLAQPTLAFQSPLSDEAVREAYFLGQRHDESTAAFFSRYLQTLAPPESGPYISEVEIYTPYTQMVELSQLHSVGYSAQQASRDYRRTSDTLLVRIRIDFTSSYGALELYRSGRLVHPPKRDSSTQSPDYHRDFRAGLSQKGEWIEPLSIQVVPTAWPASGHIPSWRFIPAGSFSSPLYGEASYSGGYGCCFIGWLVWLQYDAAEVAPDDATVEVLTTDGQHIAVRFDLSHLR
jgi:hypothetical protein